MDIIDKLPDGIHTVIGEKGTYLSGGEQQRITIARAMLKDAPILILDEATAFADPDNEAKVQAAFENMAKGKTVIMIAHRLSTVTNADRIYVMERGRIAEQGSHEDLLSQNGLYKRMYDEYTRSVEWKVCGKMLMNSSEAQNEFTSAHPGTLNESSPKGADEFSEIGGA